MNTTTYGEEFEHKVYNFLKPRLFTGEIPGVSCVSEIFIHKKYPTLTERIIIADISIENYLSLEHKKRGEWSTLIIFECKRLSNKVDIGDLDEFEKKLEKIGRYGVKGYFVTTSDFTRTALIEAKKLHYGLIKFGKDEIWKWLVSRDTRHGKNEEYFRVFLGESPVGVSPLVYEEGIFGTLSDALIKSQVILSNKIDGKIPYLSKEEIKNLADTIYTNNPGIDDDTAGHLLYRLFPDFKINFRFLPNGLEAHTNFNEKLIILSENLKQNPGRLHFSLAHELGHLVLHADILMAYEGIEGTLPLALTEQDLKWLDVQANIFASCILMPTIPFKNKVLEIFKKYSIHPPKFIVDRQPFKERMLQNILSEITQVFHVSKTAAKIKLKEEGFLSDYRNNPTRLSDILSKF